MPQVGGGPAAASGEGFTLEPLLDTAVEALRVLIARDAAAA